MTKATTMGTRVRTALEIEIDDLHDILLDFDLACPMPTMDDVEVWQGRHPAHAQEILHHAADVAEGVLAGSLMAEPRFDVRDEPIVARALDAARRLREAGRSATAS